VFIVVDAIVEELPMMCMFYASNLQQYTDGGRYIFGPSMLLSVRASRKFVNMINKSLVHLGPKMN